MEKLVIGVLGGMGTYATIHVFEQYAELFPAEKEWERPRIIIDNNCTMPSRVLAYLEGKDKDILIQAMIESLQMLIRAGANQIIIACNTAHLFLPDIYQRCPEIKTYIVNIIECCVAAVLKSGNKNVGLLGTEGTIQSKVYQQMLNSYGVVCKVPKEKEYVRIRECIEAVKQNQYEKNVIKIFRDLMLQYDDCILGCTELPILYSRCCDMPEIRKNRVFDPVYLALKKVKDQYEKEK